MIIETYTGGLVYTNGYLLEAPQGWIAIDTPQGFANYLKGHDITITHTLITHQHYDHVEDASQFSNLYAYTEMDRAIVMDDKVRERGMNVQVPDFEIKHLLKGQTTIEIAGLSFELLHVPGHSPDSIAFHLPQENLLFGGDTLFNDSIGRTDLPGGNHQELLSSIREKLYTLPDETVVYPGHGPTTTIGKEKATNSFIHS